MAKLYHQESGSERMESLAQSPGAHLIISELSLIEIESVFATKVRTGAVAKTALDHLRGLFSADITKGRLDVVLLARRHFRNAGALVRLYAVDHALRTLDALQVRWRWISGGAESLRNSSPPIETFATWLPWRDSECSIRWRRHRESNHPPARTDLFPVQTVSLFFQDQHRGKLMSPDVVEAEVYAQLERGPEV